MSDRDIEELLGSIVKAIGEILLYAFIGMKELFKKRTRIITFLIMLAVIYTLYRFKLPINQKFVPVKYYKYTMHLEALLIIPLVYLAILGGQWKEYLKKFEIMFESVGLYSKRTITKMNIKGEAMKLKDYPKYVKERQDGKCTIFYFTTNGISLDEWKSREEQLETCMDRLVIKIEYAEKSKKLVRVYTIRTVDDLKDYYRWDDKHIPQEDFKICLGEGLLNNILLDFEEISHLLIGGETGAGKSVLQNCITWQIIKKGARVFLIDFKEGIELGGFKGFSTVISDYENVNSILAYLGQEFKQRIRLLIEKDVKKLSEYNSIVNENEKLSRCFVIVDEAAEMLDKDGANKQEAELITAIEGKLKSAARLWRAVGIHLILATQRPDANVIKGQLKNNLVGRICGKMIDPQPSQMVLGSTKAVDLPEVKGRFYIKYGVDMHEFQAYFFKTSDIKKGSYVKGKMLTNREDGVNATIGSNVIDDVEEQEFIPEKEVVQQEVYHVNYIPDDE